MASRDGRRRTRETARDRRSRDASRRSPRRDRAARRPTISVVETGEQELWIDDPDPAEPVADDIAASADGSYDSDGAGDEPTSPATEENTRGGRSGTRRHGPGRERSRGRTARRRPERDVVGALSHRLRALDAKRAVVLALVIGVVALTLAMPIRTYFAQRTEFSQLATSNEQLRRQVADYQQKVNEQNDPAYIEAKARERLQLLRPGETGLVMVYPGDAERRAAEQRAEERARNPWYQNLWQAVSTPPADR
ncbi:hypothetical protein GCM10009624_20330 [Gordonia sinesedis]